MFDEAITQGAVLASILAGAAFVGSTSASRPPTIIKYFSAGMLLVASVLAGLSTVLAPPPSPADADAAAVLFLAPLGFGVSLFIDATADHIDERSGGNAGTICCIIGMGTVLAIITLYIYFRLA